MPNLEELLSRASARLPLHRSDLHPDANACKLGLPDAATLFPSAKYPESALAGLVLKLGCWSESHSIAQDIPSSEGSYWHAVVHRIEPDASNANYWFRKAGKHPIYPELFCRAQDILSEHGPKHWTLRSEWDPFLFIEWCDEARVRKGMAVSAAIEIQDVEWRLLFDYCATAKP